MIRISRCKKCDAIMHQGGNICSECGHDNGGMKAISDRPNIMTIGDGVRFGLGFAFALFVASLVFYMLAMLIGSVPPPLR